MTRMIPSPTMTGPRLADAWRMPAAAAAAAEPLHPAFARAIERTAPPGDRVGDAADREPPFSYRTDPALLDRLPERARTLLRRLDNAATEGRDRTIALSGHLDAARDRAGRISIDVQAAIRAAALPEVASLDQARTMAALGRWPAHYTDPMRAHVARIVAEGQRLDQAEAEARDLADRLREHNQRAAPIFALRSRLVEAAARVRAPVRELALPDVPASRAPKALAEARAAITEARAARAAIETAPVNWHEARALAGEAVARYAAEAGGLAAAVKWTGREIVITEAVPGLASEDRRPLRPLALLCAVIPDAVAAAIVDTLETSNDAPLAADRLRLIAGARARLRDAEVMERAALAALGDDPASFRPDCDPLIALAVEVGR